MTDGKIMVRQWSFSPYFGGQKPDSQGRYTALIPLESLPKGVRERYEAAQKDFIEEQRKALEKPKS